VSEASVGEDGISSATGSRLRVINVTDEERAQLCLGIKRLVGNRSRLDEFDVFESWVRSRGPFDYVLDGANIGFYGQGKALSAAKEEAKEARETQGSSSDAEHDLKRQKREEKKEAFFSLQKVDDVLRAAQAHSSRALVVLHTNHTSHSGLDEPSHQLIQGWHEAGVLFTSPKHHNDDWYWLYAAILSGENCKVISNDEMRDHHFGMLSPRCFVRWKERHVVHFHFRHSTASDGGARWLPHLHHPRSFSEAMQEEPSSGTWHVPSSESSRWVCAQPLSRGQPLLSPEVALAAEGEAGAAGR